MPEQGIVLENESDGAPLDWKRSGVPVAEDNPAAIGMFEARDETQQCRLAGPGRAEQRQKFAGLHVEREIVNHRRRIEAL